ncbi:MAG: polymer-forming cytoskeletal protein [Candidatus Magasanikbacteria bacterium]
MFQKPSQPTPDQKHSKDILPDEVETVVGPSVHVEGDFASEGNILVKGIVSGNVKTSRKLTVEEGAKIFANVKAGTAFISGEIQGNVRADEKLELTSTARIAGDIQCDILVVEAGALILGKVAMKDIKSELGEKPDKKKIGLRSRAKTADKVDMSTDEE